LVGWVGIVGDVVYSSSGSAPWSAGKGAMSLRIRRMELVATAAMLMIGGCGSSGSSTGSTSSASTTTRGVVLPSATGISGIAAYLAQHGTRCERLDVENEGPTASRVGPYARAMCYRRSEPTLELLVYHSASEREIKRPEMMTMPCGTVASLRALDRRTMTFAEGENFDIRAADSGTLTPTMLDELNSATEKAAVATGLRLGHAKLVCASH
jgi:hypothetical protein